VLSPLWSTGHAVLGGTPVATTTLTRVVEQVGFFTGLGVAVAIVAAAAFGRITAVSAGIRDIEAAPVAPAPRMPVSTATTETLPVRTVRTEETQTTS
jgi:hypothetical protein